MLCEAITLSFCAVVASGVLSTWNAVLLHGKFWFTSVPKTMGYMLTGPALVSGVRHSLETLQLAQQSCMRALSNL